MSQNAIGFMSYVRFDDKHENGRLTEFCQRLGGEVRVQTGEKFQIFQDRNDIAWGQQWQQRIEESLDAVTFLIPILTPGFFKSVACRGELERFLDREKRLKRGDLILPVYYVNCPIFDDEVKRKNDELAQVIGSRQYADWRELRFEPFTSPQVGRTLAKLASEIVEALERRPLQQNPTSTSPDSKKKQPSNKRSSIATHNRLAPPTVGEKAVRTVAESTTQRAESSGPTVVGALAPKTEPPTLVVDALHRGDYTTLTDALAAAKPGDRILVRPGLYAEGIVIDKPVEIIGDGELGEVVIEATGKNAIICKASMGRIANLTLRLSGGEKWYCVDIAQGRLDLEGCDISQGLACVAIHGGADPRLRRNRIHDGTGSGVFVYENGQGTLEDNDIFANALAGVSVNGANPMLRRNRIHDGKSGGVFLYQNAHGTLEDNDIFGNALAGVSIKTAGNPTLRRNRIYEGKSVGVFVYENGQGTLEDNDIFGNLLSGVEIKTGGNPALRRNRIHDGKGGGILVHDSGEGRLEGNDILANTLAGVEVKGGGNPTIRGNRISDHPVAVYVHDGGKGVFENNDLRGNSKGAWLISDDCKDKVTRDGNQES